MLLQQINQLQNNFIRINCDLLILSLKSLLNDFAKKGEELIAVFIFLLRHVFQKYLNYLFIVFCVVKLHLGFAEDVKAVLEQGADLLTLFGEESLHEEVLEVAVTVLKAVYDKVP